MAFSYSRVALTPHSGRVFSYVLNNGIITSLVAFLGDIFKSKQHLKKCFDEQEVVADLGRFSELEKIIMASTLHEDQEIMVSPEIRKRLSGYEVEDRRFRKALWADIPADDVIRLLENVCK